MQIKVIYFASLRDATQKTEETINTDAKTIDELFDSLNSSYSFTLKKSDLRVAINEEYKDFSSEINLNDTIVFIPPVAGG